MHDTHRNPRRILSNTASSSVRDRILRRLENSPQQSKSMSSDKEHVIRDGDREKNSLGFVLRGWKSKMTYKVYSQSWIFLMWFSFSGPDSGQTHIELTDALWSGSSPDCYLHRWSRIIVIFFFLIA